MKSIFIITIINTNLLQGKLFCIYQPVSKSYKNCLNRSAEHILYKFLSTFSTKWVFFSDCSFNTPHPVDAVPHRGQSQLRSFPSLRRLVIAAEGDPSSVKTYAYINTPHLRTRTAAAGGK